MFPRHAGRKYQDSEGMCAGGSCLFLHSQTARRQRGRETKMHCAPASLMVPPTPLIYWKVPLTPQPTGRFHFHSGHVFSHIALISENTLPDRPRNVLQESSSCPKPRQVDVTAFLPRNLQGSHFLQLTRVSMALVYIGNSFTLKTFTVMF